MNKRKRNIINSPKINGNSQIDSIPYLREMGIKIEERKQSIQFYPNINEHIHRWAPYVQGFSASFVQSIFDQYKSEYKKPNILDPFSGCGTVLVQAKLNGYKSVGIELNPLLQFISDTKLNNWNISPKSLITIFKNLPKNEKSNIPKFLKTEKHFNRNILENLRIIKGSIDQYNPKSINQKKIKNLLLLAFSSILIDCSNLKRSPCLGYCKNKIVKDQTPFILMDEKIQNIADDLKIIRSNYKNFINIPSKVYLANSRDFNVNEFFDLVITSPPYMNGMDYVINYKIEMGWLNFVDCQKKLKNIKNEMVACDNVSKKLIDEFSKRDNNYNSERIEKIKVNIFRNIKKRGSYRRQDMPNIVHKYFDDMYQIIKNVISVIRVGGRFILVVGDSLIADVYIPTDLIIAQIGRELGMKIEKIEKARERRSGQIRSYKLRESIITLKKE